MKQISRVLKRVPAMACANKLAGNAQTSRQFGMMIRYNNQRQTPVFGIQ